MNRMQKTSDYIRLKIDKFPKGYVFTYEDFITEVNKKEAIIKNLNRMALSGKIFKLSKGRFYKAEPTPFGNLLPDQYQIVKDLLEKNGKPIGYITGLGIYNQLGLTSQVSNVIQIGKNEVRPSLQRDRYKITFIKQKNKITKENIPLLRILDSIRYIKQIPDANIAGSCNRLLAIVNELSTGTRSTLTKLALKYPPATRALLGAIMESLGENTSTLRKSLNPITIYKLGIPKKVFTNQSNWNIQ